MLARCNYVNINEIDHTFVQGNV